MTVGVDDLDLASASFDVEGRRRHARAARDEKLPQSADAWRGERDREEPFVAIGRQSIAHDQPLPVVHREHGDVRSRGGRDFGVAEQPGVKTARLGEIARLQADVRDPDDRRAALPRRHHRCGHDRRRHQHG
jgi:hypothetical protein